MCCRTLQIQNNTEKFNDKVFRKCSPERFYMPRGFIITIFGTYGHKFFPTFFRLLLVYDLLPKQHSFSGISKFFFCNDVSFNFFSFTMYFLLRWKIKILDNWTFIFSLISNKPKWCLYNEAIFSLSGNGERTEVWEYLFL